MSAAVFVNARFTVQALTGVQRFATEIARALPEVWPPDRPLPVLLAPRGASDAPAGPLERREIGPFTGHLWEQTTMPAHARNGVLVNLGNTGPMFARRQVVVIHDAGVFTTPEAYSPRFRAWYRFLQRRLTHGSAALASVSVFSRNEIAGVFDIDPASIAVLGEGAEHLQRIPPDPTVLTQHNIQPGRYVLAVGSLAAHKNLGALIQTAAMLADRGMELVITGGFNAAVFAAAAARLPSAKFVGRVDDAALRALYEAAACFVFPSRYEGFGLPAVEAMSAGCPLVAARSGALPEVCGSAAIFCDPASGDSIAAAVASVLADPQRAAGLRAQGRVHAAAMTWAKAAENLRDVIFRCEDQQ